MWPFKPRAPKEFDWDAFAERLVVLENLWGTTPNNDLFFKIGQFVRRTRSAYERFDKRQKRRFLRLIELGEYGEALRFAGYTVSPHHWDRGEDFLGWKCTLCGQLATDGYVEIYRRLPRWDMELACKYPSEPYTKWNPA